MKIFRHIGLKAVVVFISVFPAHLIAGNETGSVECESTCQLNLANEYFDLLNAVGKKGSTDKDIEKLISSMHDDVQYIHVRFGAEFNQTSWRKAFLRNLKKGFYTATSKQEIRILRSIDGKGYLAVEYAHGSINNDNWIPEEGQLVIFGFTDGKISMIKELW
ncbi:hypothetical protein [Thalassotalea maritima]|uniref:hypothetical protein n=1 Tax=Thalassotalea maritima TaxID=3242416 RepID=UPI0035294A1C